MENLNNDLPIEDYILDRLSSEEMAKIEQVMQENPEIEQAVQEERAILKGFTYLGQEELRQQLRTIHLEVEAEEQAQLNSKRRGIVFYRWIAASIALILFVGYWYWNRDSSSQLYADFFEPYPV